jgi:hypothetical protein
VRAPVRRAGRRAAAALVPAAVAACAARVATVAPGNGRGRAPAAAPARRALLWAVGDGANGSAAGRAVAARIAATRFDRLLYLGDVYENGTAADFRRHYATTYGRLAARTAPTPGNHDWPNHATGYDPYWRRALGARLPDWYAFRAGGWQVLSLDSEAPHGRGSPQERWLRARVRGGGTCRVAFWHRPRFSAGTHHGDQPDMAPLWDDLRGHAAIVLAGHEHDMQRLRPIDGITELVSGAGGADRYTLHRSDPRLAFGNDSAFGALRLDLTPGTAAYAFVSAAGGVLDRGTIGCRA